MFRVGPAGPAYWAAEQHAVLSNSRNLADFHEWLALPCIKVWSQQCLSTRG
jgi:hypothetical protein